MANAYIQVPPQSTGLKVQVFENTVGGQVVESEAVTLVQSSDNTEVGTSGQPLRVDPTGVTTQPVSGVVSTKTALSASAPTAASVGVTTAQALAAAATRKGLILVNTSVNTISLGLGAAAVLNSGITLNPSGGTWVMDEFNFFTGAINAIASAAASNLSIQEFTT